MRKWSGATIVAAGLLAGCQQAQDMPVQPTAAATATPTVTVPTGTTAATAQPPAADEAFVVLGTEPFWSARIAGGQATYSTPEDRPGQTFPVTVSRQGAGRIFKGTIAGQPFVLQLREEACSDGMSDRNYRFAADLTVAGEARRGCAEPGTSLPPE